MKLKSNLILVCISVFSFSTSFVTVGMVYNDDDYLQYKYNPKDNVPKVDDSFNFIFTSEYQDIFEKVLDLHQQITPQYQKSFNHSIDGNNNLVITSSKNQITNAYATIIPFNLNVFYGGGAAMVDEMAYISWIKNLYLHEMAHLYQLNASEGLGKFTGKIFGPHGFFIYPIIPLPVVPYPNLITPRMLTEGNAVFNESRFGNGGRLYSGHARALVYALIKSSKLDENRLINDHLHFPFSEEKYLIGAYYSLYLAEKYGIDVTNEFFQKQSTHYLLPTILNQTYEDHFHLSFFQSVVEFLNEYRQPASMQKDSRESAGEVGEVLAKSLDNYPMSASNNKIFFLTYPSINHGLLLNIYDKNTHKFSQRKTDLPEGKLFLNILNANQKKDLFYSATSGLLPTKDQHLFGLWDEKKYFIEKYQSKLIVDVVGENILYFDMKSSFDMPHLFLNQKDLGYVNSSAILDNDANVYYFKQTGGSRNQIRTLFTNQTPLANFQGYSSKLIEIDDEKNVLFLAPTNYGQSLFVYLSAKKRIYRISDLDTIVDAKVISPLKSTSAQVLINEVTADAYQYRIINTKLVEENPNYFEYFWDKDPLLPQPPPQIQIQPLSPSSPTTIVQNYHPLTSLRLSTWRGDYRYKSDDGYPNSKISMQAQFFDPLVKNYLNASTSWENYSDTTNKRKTLDTGLGALTYGNQKYAINWFASIRHYRYYKNINYDWPTGNASKTTWKLEGGASYSRELFPFWEFKLSPSLTFSSPAHPPHFEPYSLLEFTQMKKGKHALYPYQFFRGQGEYQRVDLVNELSLLAAQSISFMEDLQLMLETSYNFSDGDKIIIGKPLRSDLAHDNIIPTTGDFAYLPARAASSDEKNLQVSRFGLSLSKLIDQGQYFSVFPLSYRRWAPRVFANYLYINRETALYNSDHYQRSKTRRSKKSLHDFELGFGATIDGLFVHVMPFYLNLDYIRRTSDKNNSYLISLGSVF